VQAVFEHLKASVPGPQATLAAESIRPATRWSAAVSPAMRNPSASRLIPRKFRTARS
jgi:hypothetical protein